MAIKDVFRLGAMGWLGYQFLVFLLASGAL